MLKAPAVRLAAARDAAAIAEFSRDHIEHGLGWNYTPDKILGCIRSRTTNVAVMQERDELLGFGVMDYGDASAHLVLLGVAASERRRGLGRHLVDWLEKVAVTAAVGLIRVEVRADNPAGLAFYGRLGYGVTARLHGYYRGTIDGLRLEKRLPGNGDPEA